jgi:thiaminase
MPDEIDWQKEKQKHLWEEIRHVCADYLIACDALENALSDLQAALHRCSEVYAELQFEFASEENQGEKWPWQDLIGFMAEVSKVSKELRKGRISEVTLAALQGKKDAATAKREAITRLKKEKIA